MRGLIEVAVAKAGGGVAPANPRACAQCPWRLSNQGQPHPHGFFDAANVRRLWNGLRTGEAPGMSCHPTDSRMAEFEGYEATAERETMHECAGSVAMRVREFMRFQAICLEVEAEQKAGAKFRRGEALHRYRAEAGRNGLTRIGIETLTWLVITGQTKLPSPELVNDPDIGAACAPTWDPDVLRRAQRPDETKETARA